MSFVDRLFGKKKKNEPVMPQHAAEQKVKTETPIPNLAPPVTDNPKSNYIFRHACSCGTELLVEVWLPIQTGEVSCAKCGKNYHYRTAEKGYIFIDGVNLRHSEKKDVTVKSTSAGADQPSSMDSTFKEAEKLRNVELLQPLNHKLAKQISSNDIQIIKNALKTAPILSDARIRQITANKPIWAQNHFESSLDKVCENMFSCLSRDFAHYKFVEATAEWDRDSRSEFVEIACFYIANNPSGGLFNAHIITRKGEDEYCFWYTKCDLDKI